MKLTIAQKIALETLNESVYGCMQSKRTRRGWFWGTINYRAARKLRELGYARLDVHTSTWYITNAGRIALNRR